MSARDAKTGTHLVFFWDLFLFFFGGEGFLFLKELCTVYHISSNNNVKVCII